MLITHSVPYIHTYIHYYKHSILCMKGVSSTANTELRLKCCFRRAVSYFELKQFDKAVVDLTDLLNADPNSIQGCLLCVIHNKRK